MSLVRSKRQTTAGSTRLVSGDYTVSSERKTDFHAILWRDFWTIMNAMPLRRPTYAERNPSVSRVSLINAVHASLFTWINVTFVCLS